MQFNVEGFYWKYRDQQYSQFGFDLGMPPASVFLTRNIGRSTIYGVDADSQFLVTRNTLLAANVQYLHTKYDSFIYFTPNQGLPPITSCGFTPTTQNGQSVFAVDCSGKPGFNAPKWSFNLNGQQTVPLGEYKLILQAGTRYRGRSEIDAGFSPYVSAGSGTTSNASITVSPDDEQWFVTAFVNNIEDFRRLVFTTQAPGGGNIVGSAEPPRTYGVRFGFKL